MTPAQFYNQREPSTKLLHEDPQDRVILLLKAQGASNKEIARVVGVSEKKVSYTVRQPWALKFIAEIIHEKGEPEIERLLQVIAKDAVEVGYNIMLSTDNEKLKAQCAFEFLKAARGQKITVEQVPSSLSEVDKEISRLQSEIAELEGLERGNARDISCAT
jgi:transposase